MSRQNSAFLTCVFIAGAASAWGQTGARAPGLTLRVYQIDGGVSAIPELKADEAPNVLKTISALDVESGAFGVADNFVSRVDGFLKIDAPGEYAFQLISDDGSRLSIHGRVVIDHDGPHGPTPKEGAANLTPGEHALRVDHFEGAGGEELRVLWKPPGEARFSPIPAARLSHAPLDEKTVAGVKRIITPLRRGRPGDGAPVAGMHPGFAFDPSEQLTEGEPLVEPKPWPVLKALVMAAGEGGADGLVTAPLNSGPYKKHALVSTHSSIYRAATDGDPHAGANVCLLRFAQPPAPMALAARKSDGALFSIRCAPPANCLSRLRETGKPVFEMLAVSPLSNGLEIEFTQPLDPRCGWEADAYLIEQRPFSANGVAARDGVAYPAKSASVSEDRRRVFLEIDSLKPGHVVYLRLLPPMLSSDGVLPWSTEAWVALNALPKDRAGQPAPRPAGEPQNVLTDAEKAEGWKLLFDGQSTAGWHGFRKQGIPTGPDGRPGWAVVDGALTRVGPGGDILTDESYQDFELRLEWRISPGGNSGVFFHVSEDEPLRYVWETGPEMQVLDNAEHADGRNPLTSASSNYALIAPSRDATLPIGLFNSARLVVKGPHVEHWLNGEKVVEYELGSPEWEKLVQNSKFKAMPRYAREKSGRIAVQDHGDRVWYRNIKIRPLNND